MFGRIFSSFCSTRYLEVSTATWVYHFCRVKKVLISGFAGVPMVDLACRVTNAICDEVVGHENERPPADAAAVMRIVRCGGWMCVVFSICLTILFSIPQKDTMRTGAVEALARLWKSILTELPGTAPEIVALALAGIGLYVGVCFC
jgi:hypothetical protein